MLAFYLSCFFLILLDLENDLWEVPLSCLSDYHDNVGLSIKKYFSIPTAKMPRSNQTFRIRLLSWILRFLLKIWVFYENILRRIAKEVLYLREVRTNRLTLWNCCHCYLNMNCSTFNINSKTLDRLFSFWIFSNFEGGEEWGETQWILQVKDWFIMIIIFVAKAKYASIYLNVLVKPFFCNYFSLRQVWRFCPTGSAIWNQPFSLSLLLGNGLLCPPSLVW